MSAVDEGQSGVGILQGLGPFKATCLGDVSTLSRPAANPRRHLRRHSPSSWPGSLVVRNRVTAEPPERVQNCRVRGREVREGTLETSNLGTEKLHLLVLARSRLFLVGVLRVLVLNAHPAKHVGLRCSQRPPGDAQRTRSGLPLQVVPRRHPSPDRGFATQEPLGYLTNTPGSLHLGHAPNDGHLK